MDWCTELNREGEESAILLEIEIKTRSTRDMLVIVKKHLVSLQSELECLCSEDR